MSFIAKKFIDESNSKELIRDIVKVIFGCALLGLSNSKLMVTNEIISGGATSLALILESLTGLSVATYSTLLSLGFLALSLIFLGGKNFFLSIISSFSYSFFFSFFYKTSVSLQINLIADILIASLINAAGYYMCISAGASTVGVEVIALIIKKKNDEYDLVKLIRFLNYSVLAAGFFIYGIRSIIIGVVYSYLYSAILDKFLNGKKKVE